VKLKVGHYFYSTPEGDKCSGRQAHVTVLDLSFKIIQRDLDLILNDQDEVKNQTTNLKRDLNLNIINKDIVETKANLHFTEKEIRNNVKVRRNGNNCKELDEAKNELQKMTSQISHVQAHLFNTQYTHIASNNLRLEHEERAMSLMENYIKKLKLEIITVGLGFSQLNINLG
jgi:hypothetical protein